MSTLESLVPSPELCNGIPTGEFDNSVFGWKYINGYSHSEWELVIRTESDVDCPAPRLEEIIMACRPRSHCKAKVLGINYNLYFDLIDNKWVFELGELNAIANDPATAALKLWLELNKE